MNIARSKDFSMTSVNLMLSEEQKAETEKIINTEDVNELLDKIGSSSIFCPSFQKIEQESKNPPISFFITNFDTQDKEGNLVKNGHNPTEVWFHTIYSFSQIPITLFSLAKIFHEIMDEKLNTVNLIDYFRSKEIFSKDFLSFFYVAIERFFSGDYVSTLHILVPQFESVFLNLTQKLDKNANVVIAKVQDGEKEKIWTQDKTLSEDFLRSENIKKIWGEDFCEQIIFVFLSQLGLKLRHKVAHGYAKPEECNFSNSVLVLYFFLVFATKKV